MKGSMLRKTHFNSDAYLQPVDESPGFRELPHLSDLPFQKLHTKAQPLVVLLRMLLTYCYVLLISGRTPRVFVSPSEIDLQHFPNR